MAIVGAVVIIALPSGYQWPKYAMMFLLTSGTYGTYCTTYAWLSSTIVRPPAKRSASIGITNSFANLAAFYGNYFWLDKYAPEFKQSWGAVIAFLVLCLACVLSLRLVLKRRNAKFDALQTEYDGAMTLNVSHLNEEQTRAVINGFRYVT